MATIKSLTSLTLDLPPSCVEFWPENPQYAVVGTYNLEKTTDEKESAETNAESDVGGGQQKSQSRNGSLILIRIDGDEVIIVQTLQTPSAILDVHFARHEKLPSCLGVATSTGSMMLCQMKPSQQATISDLADRPPLPELSVWRTFQFFPEDVLVTAFSWLPNSTTVAMTLSSSEVYLSTIDPHSGAESRHTVELGGHDLEAWTVAFQADGTGLFSGGDDSALKYWRIPDRSAKEEVFESDALLWTERKIHGAGVTAILPLEANEERTLVLTGSYDDHIRLIRAPAVGRRTILAELNLGGGVWRLKRLDDGRNSASVLLLASCMHAGSRIVSLARSDDSEWSFEVLAMFEKHQSMNYGSDSQPTLNENGQRTFVTTSFYDRLLCLWRY